MKKTIALAIALIMALTLSACSGSNGGDNAPSGNGGDNALNSTDNPPGGTGGSGNGETSGGVRNETVTLAYAPPAVGDYIYFGDYDWQILDIQDGKALLLSNYVWEKKAYHNGAVGHVDDLVETTWADCDLRAYLNGEFYNSFDADDKARIVTVTNQNPDNPWFDTNGGGDTQDNIFILSLDEVVKYLSFDVGEMQKQLQNGNPLSTDDEPTPWISDGFLGEQARMTYHKDANYYGSFESDHQHGWWLRSPGFDNYHATNVFKNGTVDVVGFNTTGREFDGFTGLFIGKESLLYIRPAMWITLDTQSGGETPDGEGETPSYVDRGERGNTVFNNLNGGIAAEKDGWIYYVDRIETETSHLPFYTICKIRPDGSERTELITDDRWEEEEDGRKIVFDINNNRPGNLNVVGDWVYFTLDSVAELSLQSDGSGWMRDREGHYICKVRTDGTQGGSVFRKGDSTWQIVGNDVVYAAFTPGQHDTMTVIGDWIYYLKATESGEGNGLYKVRTGGTQDTQLVKGDAIWRVSVVGDWIFYMLKGEAYRVRTDGAQRTKVRIDYEIECMHYWEVDSGVMGEEMYYFSISDIMVDGKHMYLLGRSGWYRFDMDMRNEVRLDYRNYGEFFNVSDGWLYYTEQLITEYHDGGRTYRYNLGRIKLDMAQTVMADGWSSPQIDVSADGTLLSELPDSHSMRIAALGDWLYCESSGSYGKIRTDGTEYEDIIGQLFSKWGVMVMPRSNSVPWGNTVIELGIEKDIYAPGETITVTIGGVTQEMADDSAYVDIRDSYFTSVAPGERSYPAAGSSTLTFNAPNEEGAYNIGLSIQHPSGSGEYAIIAFIDFSVDSSG